MNLDALITYVTILDAGSLAGAADRLHVTPSTVTARLQALEGRLGHELIKRSKAGAVPTAAGERIAQNIDTIVALWEQIERTSALGATIGDHVTIGSHPDLWPVHGEELMANLDHADLSVARTVRHGSSDELASWQRDGRTDLSLTHAPSPRAAHPHWCAVCRVPVWPLRWCTWVPTTRARRIERRGRRSRRRASSPS